MRIIEGQQYHDEWWRVRRGVPTASEFSNIITAVKGEPSKAQLGYACKLIADTYSPSYGPSDTFVSAAMKNGIETEPEARSCYALVADYDVHEVCFCLTDDGRFGCSPDGLVGNEGVLELKCPQPHTMVEWLLIGSLPDDYKQQVHGHLIVTGRKWCDFMAYSPGLPNLCVRVEPDGYTDKLRDALKGFWTLYQDTLKKLNLTAPVTENGELSEDEMPAMFVR